MGMMRFGCHGLARGVKGWCFETVLATSGAG